MFAFFQHRYFHTYIVHILAKRDITWPPLQLDQKEFNRTGVTLHGNGRNNWLKWTIIG